VHGTLISRSFRGALIHVTVQCPSGTTLAFDMPAGTGIPAVGQAITLSLQPGGIACLEA